MADADSAQAAAAIALSSGQLWGAVIVVVTALATCVTVLFRTVMGFVTAQIAAAQLVTTQDRARCASETADLAARLRQVEDRSHGEMIEITRESVRTNARCARAFEALVNRGSLREDEEKTTGQHPAQR